LVGEEGAARAQVPHPTRPLVCRVLAAGAV
jgi:hypothetical protein